MKGRGWVHVPSSEADGNLVAGTLGKTLIAACNADFLIDGEPDAEDAGPLQLEFNDGSVLVLSLVPDGETVTASVAPLEFPPEQPGYDVWHRVDLAESPEWVPLVGQSVTRCDALWWQGDTLAGWRIWLGSHSVCFLNDGDDARVLVDTEEAWPDTVWRSLGTGTSAS